MGRRTSFLMLSALVVLLVAQLTGCSGSETGGATDTIDYRQEMRDFVMGISAFAKASDSDFIVIPQNGQELGTDSGEGDGVLEGAYLQAIDATGRESMFYGYYHDDEVTPQEDRQHLLDLCLVFEQQGVEVLATDYCATQGFVDDSYALNDANGFISFGADERNLNNIPDYPVEPYHVNSADIVGIAEAKNFLYLINGENYATKEVLVEAVQATNYDLLILDLYHNDQTFTVAEVAQMRQKANGGTRLVVCYMSIGEAENYRFYWQEEWEVGNPSWLRQENPNWDGNFVVDYWNPEWQALIYGDPDSYLPRIIESGFDGVYLDIIDAFETFEE